MNWKQLCFVVWAKLLHAHGMFLCGHHRKSFEMHSPCWLDLPLTAFKCLFFASFPFYLHMTPNKSIRSLLVENFSNMWCDTSRIFLKMTVYSSECTITGSKRWFQKWTRAKIGIWGRCRFCASMQQIDWQVCPPVCMQMLFSVFFSFFFPHTEVGGEGCFSCHWWKSNSQCLMAGCYFTLCSFCFNRNLVCCFCWQCLPILNRETAALRGSTFFAYILIHAMVMVLQIY